MNVLHLIVAVIPVVFSQNDTVNIAGKTFTLAFYPEYANPVTNELWTYLYMSSTEAGSCTVSYNDGKKNTVVNLIPGQVVKKMLPDNTQMSNIGTGVESKAIYVNCTAQVTLHGYDKDQFSSSVAEPFIMLPDNLLSNQYIVSSVNQSAFIGIVAVHPDTHVSINIRSTCSYTYKHNTYISGDVLNVTLNYGDAFRLGGALDISDATCDFGGTVVSSDKPISAFSGTGYYRLRHDRPALDGGPHVRQLLPGEMFSTTIIAPTAFNGMILRIISNHDNTNVNITSERETDGHIITKYRFLNSLEYFQMTFGPDINVIIKSSAPVMVTQNVMYPVGGSLLSVPGINHYGNNYLVRGFDTFYGKLVPPTVTVVAESKSTKDLEVNGYSPKDVKWTHLSTLPYSVGSFQIGDKSTYNISCSTPILVRVDEELGLRSFSYIAGFKVKPSISNEVIKSAVELVCHEGGWDVRVDVDKLHLSNSNIPHLYLTTDTCTGTLEGGQLLFNYSYNDCNTQTSNIRGMLVYSNNLVFTSPSTDPSIVDDIWHFALECSMPNNNNVSAHLYPGHYGHAGGKITGTITEPPTHISLFKDSEYRHQIQGPTLKVEIGEPVYVQVSTNNQNTVMLVNSCDAHLEEDKHTSLPLIENGCAINPRTKHLISRNQVTRFMFEVFDMKDKKDGIYVTCHVTFCDPMDFTDKCQQGCKTSPHGTIIG